jgi:hypothetical protein
LEQQQLDHQAEKTLQLQGNLPNNQHLRQPRVHPPQTRYQHLWLHLRQRKAISEAMKAVVDQKDEDKNRLEYNLC